jgi:deoxyribodipyrimidine photo-lyase
MSMRTIAIVWFRRDLRVHDHPALTAAIADADAVVPLFVFDDALLHGRWPAPNRTWFMRESVAALSVALRERGADLRIVQGDPIEVVSRLARDVGATSVYVSRDATPYGRRRDLEVAAALTRDGIVLHPKRGLYVHEPGEVLTADGRPFSVYSPFRRA